MLEQVTMATPNVSIIDFFKKSTPKPTMTVCPVCQTSVPLNKINEHLDSPTECNPENKKETNGKEVDESDDLFDDGADPDFDKVQLTPLKRSYSFETCTSKYFSPDHGASSRSSSQGSEPFKSPQPKLRASQSISNHPNRFGGIDSLSPDGKVQFSSPSPKRKKSGNSPFSQIVRSSLSSPSKPTEVKKALFTTSSQDSSSPSKHVPFTQSKKKDPNHIPYYVVNFEFILRCVIEETDDKDLFNDQELDMVSRFHGLNLDAKKIYVRLFQRKHTWLNEGQIKYEEVQDLPAALNELLIAEFLMAGSELTDLETVLGLLSAPNVRSLAKEMKVFSKGTQKNDYVVGLLAHSKQKNFFVKNGQNNGIAKKIMKKACSLLGNCHRLSDEPRKVFLRILSLYSLTNWWDERENETGQPQQLTTILLVNQGKMTFPSFDIIRKRKLFQSREELICFEDACAVEARMSDAFELKDWSKALDVFQDADVLFDDVMKDQETEIHVRSLPVFLRKFTKGSVLAYVLTKSVEVLERNKMHDEAVILLRKLVSQHLYLPDYHGHWYERLVLDLDQHLKDPKGSLAVIKEGLKDPNVRVARKLALCQRVVKICNMKKNLKAFETEYLAFQSDNDWVAMKDTPKMVIQGKMMPKDNIPGAKTVFLHGQGEDKMLCSVEEYVREVYKDEEHMTHGLHAEGAVVNTICAILFWNILYDCPVADAFRSPNQARPLDFDTDDFYANRREAIDERLSEIIELSDAELKDEISRVWDKSFGIVSCVNWEVFHSVDHLMGLLYCFSRLQLKGICERLIKNHRYTRSGFPDLTLWNPEAKKCQIVEVKGPNDRLSNKQILWIEYLNQLGIKSFVCHVEAIGGKGDRFSRFSKPKSEVATKNRKRKKSEETRKSQQSKTISAHDDDSEDFM